MTKAGAAKNDLSKAALPSDVRDGDLPLSIHDADSILNVKASLAFLARQETEVTARLEALLATQRDLSRDLDRLDLLRANLGSQAVSTRSISNGMLSDAASTARARSAAPN